MPSERRIVRHLPGALVVALLVPALAPSQGERPEDLLVRLDMKFRAVQVSETRSATRTVGPGYQAITQAVTQIKRRAGLARYRTEATTQTTWANGTTAQSQTLVVADGTHLWIQTTGSNGQLAVLKAPQPAEAGSDLHDLIEVALDSEVRFLPGEKWGQADCSVVLMRTPASAFVKVVADTTFGVLYRVQVKLPDGTVTDSVVEAYDSTRSFADSLFVYEPPAGIPVQELAAAPPMANLRARGVPLPPVAAAKLAEEPKVAAGP